MHRAMTLVFGVMLLAITILSGTAVGQATPAAAAGLTHGRGRLRISAPPVNPPAAAPAPDQPRHITVHVTRSGQQSVIDGPVTITGMPVAGEIEIGDVDWNVTGSAVSGRVTGNAGNEVATFDGTITSSGVGGTFTLPNGRRATWSWDGPLPQ